MNAISVPLFPAEQRITVPFRSGEDLIDNVDVKGAVEIRDRIKTFELICTGIVDTA